jgi:hypothetical protein
MDQNGKAKMLDQFLGWTVIVLPFVFAVVIEVVNKNVKERTTWRVGVIAFGVLLSGLMWFQMSRATKAALVDRNGAVAETSQRVSASVTQRQGEDSRK